MARVAVICALVALVAAGCGARDERAVPAKVQGLAVERPAGWQAIRDPVCGFLGAGVSFTNEARLALHAHRLTPQGKDCSNFWDLRSVPRSFVLVDVEKIDNEPPPVLPGEPRDTPLPPALELRPYLLPIRPPPPRMCWCTFRVATAVVHGNLYDIRTWEGYGSSGRDRRLARGIVASIRPA